MPNKFQAGYIKRHLHQDTLWSNADKGKILKAVRERNTDYSQRNNRLWAYLSKATWIPESSGIISSKCRVKITDNLNFYTQQNYLSRMRAK